MTVHAQPCARAVRAKFYRSRVCFVLFYADFEKRKRGQNKTSVSFNCILVLLVAVNIFPTKVRQLKELK